VIGPLIINVWMKNPTGTSKLFFSIIVTVKYYRKLVLMSVYFYTSDHLIVSVITDLFESLASNTTAYSAFQARALPSLVNIINNVTDSAAIAVIYYIPLVFSLINKINKIINLFKTFHFDIVSDRFNSKFS
jgi:hypothetical protein